MKIIDMHCDTIMALMNNKDKFLRSNDGHLDLIRMKEADYLVQCFAMFVPLKQVEDPFKFVNLMIDKFYLEIQKNSDLIEVAYSYDDIIKNEKNNKMSALLTIEEGGVTENHLEYLRNLYRLGVRMITLTWNYENGIGYPNFKMPLDSSKPDMKGCNMEDGLTEYGIQMIKEMESLGMIIDVSHLSDKGFYDVLENTTKPFCASHSNSRSVCGSCRNMTDDMIIKLSKRGGVMGINYCPSFVNNEEDENFEYAKVHDLVKHIIHIKEIAGIDCIGLGSDFDGIGNNLELNSASKVTLLKDELINAGFTQEEIEKIFYKNVLRLFKDVLK